MIGIVSDLKCASLPWIRVDIANVVEYLDYLASENELKPEFDVFELRIRRVDQLAVVVDVDELRLPVLKVGFGRPVGDGGCPDA